jgi:hypothetical protein
MEARVGLGRIIALTHFAPDALAHSVPLLLRRQCDRTLGPLLAGAAGAEVTIEVPLDDHTKLICAATLRVYPQAAVGTAFGGS